MWCVFISIRGVHRMEMARLPKFVELRELARRQGKDEILMGA